MIDGEEKQRAWCCVHYVRCLSQAAQIDAGLDCPCSRFLKSENAVHLRDIDGVKLLTLAVLVPEVFELFQQIRATPEKQEKLRLLRLALSFFNDRYRGIGRHRVR